MIGLRGFRVCLLSVINISFVMLRFIFIAPARNVNSIVKYELIHVLIAFLVFVCVCVCLCYDASTKFYVLIGL